MRILAFLIGGAIWFMTASAVQGQSITLDHVDGLHGGNPLELVADGTTPIVFYIRVTGDGDAHGGLTNGFRVYSTDGATWTTTVHDTLGTLGRAQFDGGFFLYAYSVDGSGADTVGYTAFRFFGPGLPAGFDDVAFSIRIGPIDTGDHGKTICLDSSFFPPSGVWKWAGPDVFPSWSGPHCYTCVNPGATGVGPSDHTTLPEHPTLSQNYPNPFNPATSIEFLLPSPSHVELAVYNLLGQEIVRLVDRTMPAGSHRAVWDGITTQGHPAPAGLYFYRPRTEEFVKTRRMLLLK